MGNRRTGKNILCIPSNADCEELIELKSAKGLTVNDIYNLACRLTKEHHLIPVKKGTFDNLTQNNPVRISRFLFDALLEKINDLPDQFMIGKKRRAVLLRNFERTQWDKKRLVRELGDFGPTIDSLKWWCNTTHEVVAEEKKYNTTIGYLYSKPNAHKVSAAELRVWNTEIKRKGICIKDLYNSFENSECYRALQTAQTFEGHEFTYNMFAHIFKGATLAYPTAMLDFIRHRVLGDDAHRAGISDKGLEKSFPKDYFQKKLDQTVWTWKEWVDKANTLLPEAETRRISDNTLQGIASGRRVTIPATHFDALNAAIKEAPKRKILAQADLDNVRSELKRARIGHKVVKKLWAEVEGTDSTIGCAAIEEFCYGTLEDLSKSRISVNDWTLFREMLEQQPTRIEISAEMYAEAQMWKSLGQGMGYKTMSGKIYEKMTKKQKADCSRENTAARLKTLLYPSNNPQITRELPLWFWQLTQKTYAAEVKARAPGPATP